jgi:hypothetical protein
MNLDRVHEGQIIKNYKQLCNLLGEKPKSDTNLKINQINEFKRYMDFVFLEKRTVKIIEIYQTIRPAINKRIGKNKFLYGMF